MRAAKALAGRGRCSGSPRADFLEDRDQSVHVHHLAYTIVYRLPHQRMVGDLSITRDVLQTCRRIRKRGRQEILRLHALELWRQPRPFRLRGIASAIVAFQRQ